MTIDPDEQNFTHPAVCSPATDLTQSFASTGTGAGASGFFAKGL